MKDAPHASPSDGAHAATSSADRRVWPRIPAKEIPQLSAELTTGPDIRLIDISKGGALFECSKRLVPSSTVALRLVTPDGTHIVRGRVVRSRIVRLERGGLGYEAAISFNEALREFVEAPAAHVPAAQPETAPAAAAAAAPAAPFAEVLAASGHPAETAQPAQPPQESQSGAPAETTGAPESSAAPAPDAQPYDETWLPPIMTLTASVLPTSEELRAIFNGNDW